MKTLRKTEEGFSAVELLATLLISAVLVLAFYQLFTIINQTNADLRLDAAANNMAYSNLRKYTSKPAFACDGATDMTLPGNNDPVGHVLYTSTTNDSDQLPNPVMETIKVYAPRGCDSDMPAKIESIVEYGTPATKVSLATYVNPED